MGYLANSCGVTLLTFSSVVCADRIVAASNWNAFSCTSAHSASGYSCASRSMTMAARALAPRGRAMAVTLGERYPRSLPVTGWIAMTLNTAPVGSATTAKRPGSMSIGGLITAPPSSVMRATASSVSTTLK